VQISSYREQGSVGVLVESSRGCGERKVAVLGEGKGRDGVVVAVVEESSHEQAAFGLIVIGIVEQTATGLLAATQMFAYMCHVPVSERY
jgi:hypothetical protein